MERVRYEDVELISGSYAVLAPLLPHLKHRGFCVVLCCGESTADQLVAVYHPDRVKSGATVRCERCSSVHLFNADSREFARVVQNAG